MNKQDLIEIYEGIDNEGQVSGFIDLVLARGRDWFKASDEYKFLEDMVRKLWWEEHFNKANHYLYGDDGEMQCNVCLIDFKRETLGVLGSKRVNFLTLLSSRNGRIHILKDAVEADFDTGYWRQIIVV